MTNLQSVLKSRDILLLTKVHTVKAMVFSSSHIWMWELDHKEGWVPKNWCFWTVVLEDSWESLDSKETRPVNPKGSQLWIFIGRTDADAEAPILWPPDAKSQLTGKDCYWQRLRAGEGDDRGWDGWMASPTQCTWVWANSRRWWRTGKPCVLPSKESDTTRWLNSNTIINHITFQALCMCQELFTCIKLFCSQEMRQGLWWASFYKGENWDRGLSTLPKVISASGGEAVI